MNKNLKRLIAYALITAGLCTGTVTNAVNYGWSDVYLKFCQSRGIISGDENGDLMPDSNLTREQMVKMILIALSVDMNVVGRAEYDDVSPDRWSYRYISKYQEYEIEGLGYFKPTEEVTREEFIAMTMKVAGFGDYVPMHAVAMRNKFSDWDEITEKYFDLITIAFEKNCITGSDGKLRPTDKLTRAEACTMLYKIIHALENSKLSEYYYDSLTKKENTDSSDNKINELISQNTSVSEDNNIGTVMLVGKSEVTLEQAKAWARNRGAHQRFVDIADLYWKYEEITGLRADILYAQAAKETNFGKYTGQVKPEQNNWAGIKKYGATGDAPEDHEDFATPDDGVRGHFNHMCAYVGLTPVGEPHGRYKSAKSLSWAGTVKTVQQLGGKWCPNTDYGNSIIRDYLEPMKATIVK